MSELANAAPFALPLASRGNESASFFGREADANPKSGEGNRYGRLDRRVARLVQICLRLAAGIDASVHVLRR
jgi:hypothetical protein